MSKEIKIILCISVICCICCFFLGRCTNEVGPPKIEYLKGDPIHDTIPKPYPVITEKESAPKWKIKRDTLWRDSIAYVKEKIDTSAILSDWILKRKYANVMFDNDTIGKLTVNATVQYNELQGLGYDFVPIRKVITNTKKPVFEPFIMGGVQTNRFNGINPTLQGGIFYKNFGLSYDITIDNFDNKQQYLHTFKVGWKF